jgi:hypothetical protein
MWSLHISRTAGLVVLISCGPAFISLSHDKNSSVLSGDGWSSFRRSRCDRSHLPLLLWLDLSGLGRDGGGGVVRFCLAAVLLLGTPQAPHGAWCPDLDSGLDGFGELQGAGAANRPQVS